MTSANSPPSHSAVYSAYSGKSNAIDQCLRGRDGQVFSDFLDLHQLRELALSHGGLQSMVLRRRAWPKLFGAHHALWENIETESTVLQSSSTVYPTVRDRRRRVHALVKNTLWRQAPTEQPWRPRLYYGNDESEPVNVLGPATPEESPASPKPLQRRVSFNLPDLPERLDGSQLEGEGRIVLRNILLQLHRKFGDDVLYDGIQNLVAVLWIVLESPSLTSVAAQTLAAHYWKRPNHTNEHDAQNHEETNDNHNASTYQSNLFMSLLLLWDPQLYYHFRSIGVTDTPECIASSWIPFWFTQELRQWNQLVRLWDVFLASHPTCVVYFSVALTVFFRDALLLAKSTFRLNTILSHLPSEALERFDNLAILERVVSRCLTGMAQYPPPTSHNNKQSAKNLSSLPSWIFDASAPTDWNVVRTARQLREAKDDCQPEEPVQSPNVSVKKLKRMENVSLEKHPLAAVAMGLPRSSRLANRSEYAMFFFLSAFVIFALFGMGVLSSPEYKEALRYNSWPEQVISTMD